MEAGWAAGPLAETGLCGGGGRLDTRSCATWGLRESTQQRSLLCWPWKQATQTGTAHRPCFIINKPLEAPGELWSLGVGRAVQCSGLALPPPGALPAPRSAPLRGQARNHPAVLFFQGWGCPPNRAAGTLGVRFALWPLAGAYHREARLAVTETTSSSPLWRGGTKTPCRRRAQCGWSPPLCPTAAPLPSCQPAGGPPSASGCPPESIKDTAAPEPSFYSDTEQRCPQRARPSYLP